MNASALSKLIASLKGMETGSNHTKPVKPRRKQRKIANLSRKRNRR